MAYCLHIERDEQQISLEEWVTAVSSTEGARLQRNDTVAVNPVTDERIVLRHREGDVEIEHPEQAQRKECGTMSNWISAIGFYNGRGTFRAGPAVDDPDCPVRRVARDIARALDARIVGDEGELYEW
jgi:hypothetical protein